VIEDAVTVQESALLNGLREIPDGDTRDMLMALLRELVDYVRDPRCPHAQGDGAPCTTVSLACEQCQQIESVLARLRRGLHSA
jgi:hypothetical protein